MSTRQQELQGNGCFTRAEEDEPMFILLARDRHAPTLIWLWATLRELDSEDPAKVNDARECVAAMIDWAAAHDRKVVGLGHAALVGCMELVRCANLGVKDAKNVATTADQMRVFLGRTVFEDDGK